MEVEKLLIDSYISYLDHCFVCDKHEKCGWYRDLKRRDRIGTVATAQIALTYSGANKDIPENNRVFENLYKRKLPNGSWPFISNIDHVGVVDATAWALQALLLKQSPFRAVERFLCESFSWLAQSQNDDGGWGIIKNSESRIISTSFSLRAFCLAKQEKFNFIISKGITFILDRQNINYSWSSASSDSCIAATSHAIVALSCCSDSRTILPIKRSAHWLLSKCTLEDNKFFDNFSKNEEVEAKVDGRIVRFNYSFPITPLAIRALRTALPSNEIVQKIYNQYVEELTRHRVFIGLQTENGHDTSYGIHDIVWSIIYSNIESNNNTKSEVYNVESIKQKINNTELPQLFDVTKPKEGKKYTCSVVFIHGLGGHAINTWVNENTNCFLPSVVATELPYTRVYTVGYENSSSSWSGDAMSLYNRSINLIKLFEISDITDRNLVLIGHSFGGLLIKSILCGIHSFETKGSTIKKVLEKTVGVCFIATPHYGSKLANFAESLSIVFRASASTKDLIWKGEELTRLNTQYKTITTDFGVKHLSFSETRPVKNITIVVDEESADIGIPGARVIPIDANHIEIAKPLNSESLLTKSIIQWIKKF